MRKFTFLVCCLFPFLLAAQSNLDEQLEIISDWFIGEFDNFQQVHKEIEDSVEVELRHERIHSIFAPLEIRDSKGYSFFVKQFQNGDESKVYRQRIYDFHPNETEQAIQLDIYSFTSPEDEEKYRNLDTDPALIGDLKLEQLRLAKGCEVYWKYQNDHFIGYMKEGSCHFFSKRSGKKIFITDSLRLSENELWIRDKAYDEEGNYVFGNKANIHHKLKRCHNYSGWMAIQKPDSEDYYLMRGIELHNQGGKSRLIDSKTNEETKYFVELSEVIYGKDTKVIKLAIYEENNSRALVYSWAAEGAALIGINTRKMTAGFTKK